MARDVRQALLRDSVDRELHLGRQLRQRRGEAPLDGNARLVRLVDRSEAQAAEQMRVDFVANASHELRTPLANLIGYSYRKLGDYKLSQTWYERALKTDPNHVLTWQYYGLWQIDQGNRDHASYHLARIAAICGTGCEEYRSLAAALEKAPGTGLVY